MTNEEKIAYLEGRVDELSNQVAALLAAQTSYGWPVAVNPQPYQPYVVSS
jgi:hypothetical protein